MSHPQAGQIDRNSPVPYYFQLAEIVEEEIVSGRWEPGTRLPSEPDLCDQYALSRTTIRQALARLEQKGLITRDKGRGTFVSSSWPRFSSAALAPSLAMPRRRAISSLVNRVASFA